LLDDRMIAEARSRGRHGGGGGAMLDSARER
jgi:hypothetical protein